MSENTEIKIEDLKNHILGYDDLPVVKVTIPEWGGIDLYVRAMNGYERDSFMYSKWQARQENDEDNANDDVGTDLMNNITASTLARVICSDPEGKNRVFSDDEEEILALGRKSAAALNRLNDAFKQVNGDLVDDEEMEKNLLGQGDDPGLKDVEDQE